MRNLSLILLTLCLSGCLVGHGSPLGPSVPASLPIADPCAFVGLGAITPSATQGPLVIRNAADWALYRSHPYIAVVNYGPVPSPVTPTELDSFDFSRQMVLVFSAIQGMHIKFTQACSSGGRLSVRVEYVYNDAIGAYYTAQAQAIAVPQSNLPQDWTDCSVPGLSPTTVCQSVTLP